MAAFGIVHRFEGGTKQQYDTTVKAVHPGEGKQLPAGQTYHAAGPTDDGFAVVAIWDSKAAYEKFRDETLGPTLANLDGGLPGPPVETTFDVHNEVSA